MHERRVVLLVFPGFQPLDLTGPHEVFAGAAARARRTGSPSTAYRVDVVAATAGVVRSESGLGAVADHGIADVPPASVDTLVVAGGWGIEDARRDAELVAWVRAVGRRARRVASVCSGAFLLAEAGLLDGRRAATHWARAGRLAADYPRVDVDPEAIVVHEGRIWTSAGVTTGIDLALAMVAEDHGIEVARDIARWLVVFLHRPGGQGQFAAPAWSPPSEREPVRAVQDVIHARPDADLSLTALARHAGMSERHLLRVFRREVGATPARYVETVRVDAARRLLEQTTSGVEHVARASGFGTAESMRRAFLRHLGVAPSAYRTRFHDHHQQQEEIA
jgi:transcriptional regulator GlxA family with amidase domain